jgi:hypothetical protein
MIDRTVLADLCGDFHFEIANNSYEDRNNTWASYLILAYYFYQSCGNWEGIRACTDFLHPEMSWGGFETEIMKGRRKMDLGKYTKDFLSYIVNNYPEYLEDEFKARTAVIKSHYDLMGTKS